MQVETVKESTITKMEIDDKESEELDKSLAELLQSPPNPSSWRDVCISSLSFFTEKTKISNDSENLLKDQLKNKATKLKDALSKFQSNLSEENQKLINLAYEILADTIWLTGQLLEKTERSSMLEEAWISFVSSFEDNAYLQSIFKITMEAPLLEKGKIISNKDLYTKKFKRHVSLELYKQRKFNIFIEETQGYSKLISLCFWKTNFNSSFKKKVNELIGTFELDPNRVLDVMVQCFMYHLSKDKDADYSYFISSFHDLNTENIPHMLRLLLEDESTVDNIVDRSYIFEACALFILEGLVSVEAFIPYLSPSPDDNYKLYDSYIRSKRIELRKFGQISLNSSSNNEEKKSEGTAASSSAFSAKTDSESLLKAENQLLEVATNLINHKAWAEGYKIITIIDYAAPEAKNYFGIGCVLYPQLGKSICNLLHYIINPIYQKYVKKEALITFSTQKSNSNVVISKQYQVKQITSFDEFLNGINMPMRTIMTSCCIADDPILYCKLCRLFQLYLKQKYPQDELFYTLLSHFLVPSLSLFPNNAFLSNEVWSILTELNFHIRYALYDSWRGYALEKNALRPPLNSSKYSPKPLKRIECEIKAGMDCSYVLKRLSKENVKDMGRKLSKISHANPIVVFGRIFLTMEPYDNLIPLIIDSLRFVTGLGLDVISYEILHTMQKLRNPAKKIDSSTSSLITPLETFAGHFYKKYPYVELRALLAYIRTTFQSTFLPTQYCNMLRSLVSIVGGYDHISSTENTQLSEVQLEGKGGSHLLKRETCSFGVIEKMNKKASRNLKELLFEQNNDETGVSFGKSFLILCAMMRNQVFTQGLLPKDEKPPIKLLGSRYDDTHGLMLLLLEFLTDYSDTSSNNDGQASNVEDDNLLFEDETRFAKIIPTMKEFIDQNFSVDTPTIWMLCRSLIRAVLFYELKNGYQKEQKKEKEDAMVINDDGNDEKKISCSSDGKSSTLIPSFLLDYSPTSQGMKDSCLKLLPSIPNSDGNQCYYFSYLFYWMFWSLSFYDIHCPESRYEQEITRLKKEQERLQTKSTNPSQGSSSLNNNLIQGQNTTGNISKLSKTDEISLERAKKVSELLSADCKTQKEHVEFINKYLSSQKDNLFPSKYKFYPEQIITYTFFPRLIYSPDDAIYCAKFISTLHELSTPNFYTIDFINVLIPCICGSLYGFTEDEAANVSIFMLYLLKDLIVRWRYDDDGKYFQREVGSDSKRPGGLKGKIEESDDKETSNDKRYSYDEFKSLYNSWHEKLGLHLIGCLNSSEYIHTRTALIILSRIITCFPTKPSLGDKILKAVEPLLEDASKPDIQAMANGYSGRLTKIRDELDFDKIMTDSYFHREIDVEKIKAHVNKMQEKKEEKTRHRAEATKEMKEDNDRIVRDLRDQAQHHHQQQHHRQNNSRGNLMMNRAAGSSSSGGYYNLQTNSQSSGGGGGGAHHQHFPQPQQLAQNIQNPNSRVFTPHAPSLRTPGFQQRWTPNVTNNPPPPPPPPNNNPPPPPLPPFQQQQQQQQHDDVHLKRSIADGGGSNFSDNKRKRMPHPSAHDDSKRSLNSSASGGSGRLQGPRKFRQN